MLSVAPCGPDVLFSALHRTLPLCGNAVILMPLHALPLRGCRPGVCNVKRVTRRRAARRRLAQFAVRRHRLL
jgi:hypothetical protein